MKQCQLCGYEFVGSDAKKKRWCMECFVFRENELGRPDHDMYTSDP